MIPKSVKFASAIMMVPILVGLIARYNYEADQFLRTYFNTFSGRVMISYTMALFCFFAGSLWGFACGSKQQSRMPFMLSLLPAFYMLGAHSFSGQYRTYIFVIGFVLLLPLDKYFKRTSLAPDWWLRFKIPATVTIIFSLLLYQLSNFILATLALT